MDAQDGQDEGACCIFRRVTATLSSQVAVGLKKARSGSVGVLEAQEVLAVCGEKEVSPQRHRGHGDGNAQGASIFHPLSFFSSSVLSV